MVLVEKALNVYLSVPKENLTVTLYIFVHRIPGGCDLWLVYMDVITHRLEPWQKIMPQFTYNKDIPFFETLVPTTDTVRFGYIMERLIYVNHPVFLTGDTGKLIVNILIQVKYY